MQINHVDAELHFVLSDLIHYIPFVTILLSIALLGSTVYWHRYYMMITLCISILSLIISCELQSVYEILLEEYMPFIILISSLFIISSNIVIKVRGKENLLLNIKLLLIGMGLSSIIGTMGSSMMMIHALLNVNKTRKSSHTIVFFIMLVSNVSGSLSSIADPPLFLGYLSGVPFIWPTINLFIPFCFVSSILLIIYILIDYAINRDIFKTYKNRIHIYGLSNICFIFAIIAITVLANHHTIFRDISILIITAIAYRLGNKKLRTNNDFSIEPVKEMIFTFLCIFITSSPVLSRINNIDFDLSSMQCFWISGLLSAILDNAPTYMMFYKAIGGYNTGNHELLKAISLGSVMMGGMTYIGNAPNMMVRAIAIHKRISVPSFFSYLTLTICTLGSTLTLYSYIALV